jgi:diacylglycerol kinase family enzyme
MNGTHGRFPQVRMGSFRRMTLKSDEPVTIHADGEIFAGFTSNVTSLTAEILPAEINVLL